MSRDKDYESLLWERIKDQIPKISKRDARFRQVDKLPALGAYMKTYESCCADCGKYKKDIERVIASLSEVLNYKASDLEREFSYWTKHLQQKHCIYPCFYFGYRYTTYGLIAGLIIGLLISFLQYSNLVLMPIIVIAVIPMSVGYFYGTYLDSKINKEKRNY